jgi:DNA recombination protein RmuC
MHFFSDRFKALSDKALYENSQRFMDMAQSHFSGYVRAIRELGLELFERLSTMAGHMNRLGKDIERTAATFNRTLGAMEKRVLVSARKFENLGVSSAGLPDCEPVPETALTLKRMKERRLESETDEST